MHFIATFVDWTRKVWRWCRKTESEIKSLARNHILSPNFREKHQNSWGRISTDFCHSLRQYISFRDLEFMLLFAAGGLYRGKLFVLSCSMAMKQLTPRWWSTKSWGLVIGGDRLTSGNQGIQIRHIWRISRCSLGRRPGTQDSKRSLLEILGLGDIRTQSLQH